MNVLLSRARIGEILIGSSQTLRTAKDREGRKLWTALLDKLEASGAVCDGLPARCATHGTSSSEPLNSRATFERHCKHGGCQLLCRGTLPCGHSCPLMCHIYDPSHQRVVCNEVKITYCDLGHIVEKPCSEQTTPSCKTCDDLARIDRDERARISGLQKEAAKRKAAADLKRKKKELEIEEVRRQIAELQQERTEALRATRVEIEEEKQRRELGKRAAEAATDIVLERATEMKMASDAMDEKEEKERNEKEAQLREARKMIRALELKQRMSNNALSALEKQTQRELQSIDNQISEVKCEAEADSKLASHSAETDRSNFERQSDLRASLCKRDADLRAVLRTFDPKMLLHALDFLRDKEAARCVVEVATATVEGESWPSDIVAYHKYSFEFIAKGQWLRAHALLCAPADVEGNGTTAILKGLCQYQLGNADGLSEAADAAEHAALPLRELAQACAALHAREVTTAYALALKSAAHPWLSAHQLLGPLKCIARSVVHEADKLLARKPEVSSAELTNAYHDKLLQRAGTSTTLAELFKLTGLGPVKLKFTELKDQITLDRERDEDVSSRQYNAIFTGNPGTPRSNFSRVG